MELKFNTTLLEGTTHLMMNLLEFMKRLAELVPRSHLIGCLCSWLSPAAVPGRVRALVRVPGGCRWRPDGTARLCHARGSVSFEGRLIAASASGSIRPSTVARHRHLLLLEFQGDLILRARLHISNL
ncbi:hypothetical protein KAK06_14790 [Ideonella sp. 4Y11]|uniref:Uncharacterized protein n=1 Tax=Ideonella aquatica TaxID=2824119 RepID=A0A940YIQ6_9BURK|nr:hypothetical protein [Ideonella aquatica]MBQ0960219.1 hypothetical protein [Ideonella aquatica]